MPSFLFFEPHSSPEVVMGPILQMRKLRSGDVSAHAWGPQGLGSQIGSFPAHPAASWCLAGSVSGCISAPLAPNAWTQD